MRHAYDEVVADAVKRQHSAQRVVGDLLTAEIDEKQARSIKCQMTIAKLPLAKEIAAFDFAGTPINEPLVRDLATGGFLASQRNAVLVGGTGTGKTHLAIAIGRACVRTSARVRFYNTVDLAAIVNVTSGLAFVPTARAATYCATKAAFHSYTISLREKLKGQVEVIELAPPGVQTELTPGQSTRDGYMPLANFIEEAMAGFAEQPTPGEIAVGRAGMTRKAERDGRFEQAFAMLNPPAS